VVGVGIALTVVAVVSLGIQAARGTTTVNVQRSAKTIHNTALDNAFYHCIDVQARSVVSPDEPVLFGGGLGDVVTMIKGMGSWITIADPASEAVARVSLRNNVTTGDTCLGTVVIATSTHGTHIVHVGSGANVPGEGPPPAPPL
jgi:hypothetical protein